MLSVEATIRKINKQANILDLSVLVQTSASVDCVSHFPLSFVQDSDSAGLVQTHPLKDVCAAYPLSLLDARGAVSSPRAVPPLFLPVHDLLYLFERRPSNNWCASSRFEGTPLNLVD